MKYRGRIVVTEEFMNKFLGLPDNVKIRSMSVDPNSGNFTVILESDASFTYRGVDLTYKVDEGQVIPQVDESFLDKVREGHSNDEIMAKLNEIQRDIKNYRAPYSYISGTSVIPCSTTTFTTNR